MSVELRNESASFWGNEKWVATNPDRSCKSTKTGKIIASPIISPISTETKKGNTVATIGKKRERGETKKTGNGKGSNGVDDNNVKKEGKNSDASGESEHGVHIWTERERRKKMRTMFANLHALLPQLPPKADKSSIVDEAVSYIKTLQQTLQKLQRQKLQPPLIATAATTDDKILPEPPSFATATFGDQQPTGEAFPADHNDGDMMMMNISADNGGSNSNNNMVVFQTWTSTNLVLNICGGDEAQFNICSPPGSRSGAGSIFTVVCYVLEKHNIEVLSAHVSSNSDRRLLMVQARLNHPEINNGGGHDHGLGADDNQAMVGEEIFKLAAAEMLNLLPLT